MQKELKDKLERVVELVNNVMVDPEIDIEYFMPGVHVTVQDTNASAHPYILVKYVVSQYTQPIRKIHLTKTYTQHEAQAIANLVTFSIEQFKMEIDSVEMG